MWITSISRSSVALALFLFITGCTSTQHVALDPTTTKHKVDVYLRNNSPPQRDYRIVSYVETTGAVFASKKDLIKGMQRRALMLDGDAVIDVEFFYIPWILASLPAAEGTIIKYIDPAPAK